VKALVTGYRGFVGRNLVERLQREDIEWIPFEAMKRGEHIDFIYHCAAELYDESKMINSNIGLTKQILDLTKDIDYKSFIYIGSSSEYGKVDHPISEKDPVSPTNLYEITKSTGSLLCRIHAEKYKKPIVVVRPFSLYGPYERECRFVPTIYQKALTREIIQIYEGVHDWVYIDDFIDALMIISQLSQGADVVNVGTGIESKNAEVVDCFERVLNRSVLTELKSGFIRPYDNLSWVCNPVYAKEKYGIVCKTTLKEGIEKYVEWRRLGNA
jgi:nucleoside-diphosphate-sugar epimerase